MWATSCSVAENRNADFHLCPQQILVLQATLAAANVAARLQGFPVWGKQDILPFVDGPFDGIPKASPSIVNAADLQLQSLPA